MQTITETKILFSSLAELLEATKGHQLTAQELINGRTYINGKGWENIELTSELKQEICSLVSNTLGGHNKTKESVYNSLMYSRPQHWGLSRIFFDQYEDGRIKCSYCAGQDYTSETQIIRNFLKR